MLELLLLLVFCVLVGLGCLGAIAWVVLSGEELGVERIFLVMVCFVVASLFLGLAGWIATRSPFRALSKTAEAPANPKAAPASKQKSAPEEASKSAS